MFASMSMCSKKERMYGQLLATIARSYLLESIKVCSDDKTVDQNPGMFHGKPWEIFVRKCNKSKDKTVN